MEYHNALLRKWATTSQRLSIGFLCMLVLAVSLLGICYWALDRVLQEEKNKVTFHFTRLIGAIGEHEIFLTQIAQESDEAARTKDSDVVPLQRRLLVRRNGMELYEGREFSFAMPFTLATSSHAPTDGSSHEAFSLGVLLTNFYGAFWSTSAVPSPQLLVLDRGGDTSLAVPAIDLSPVGAGLSDAYREQVARVSARLPERLPTLDDVRVRWLRADQDAGPLRELLGYVSVELPEPLWWRDDPGHSVVAVSLLDLSRLNNLEYLLERPIFTSLSLQSPEGELLSGPPPRTGLDNGLSFDGQGLVIRLSSQGDGGWVGVYRIGYGNFFRQAQWPLLGLLLSLPGAVLAGWLALRWYSRQVVGPVRKAHRRLMESETFSRTVIQAAPVALVVLGHKGRQLITHNQLAEQWLGGAQDILQLTAGWQLFESQDPPCGELCILVGERYLQVAFAATRYAGEDAVLCVFNDISVHREAEVVLDRAKRTADAASEAKTQFLANMSHEIRTPLYGVLGTLELLGLTDLKDQQRAYLHTIQCSSATLLQLISDILDVSKIEAGQMPLNPAGFSPAELAEEVLSNYAASAAAKRLQFYGCIDARVPAQLLGDVARIRQILNNLISNALKFTDIGRVVLRLKVLGRENGRTSLQWQIADTGIGIPEDQQGRLFEAFFQVAGTHHTSGTGLGLSISWRLAEMMGGSLRVVSEVGLGSSFSLFLELPEVGAQGPAILAPRVRSGQVYVQSPVRELADSVGAWLEGWGCNVLDGEPPRDCTEGMALLELLPVETPPSDWPGPRVRAVPEATNQPELRNGCWYVSLYSLSGIAHALALAQNGEAPMPVETSVHPGRLGLRVLVVEDNPVNQALLCEQLAELGCSSSVAGDGLQALQQFDASRFDVLLSDVNMPNMNGYELTRALRERGEDIPIIGVTANAMREEGERCRAVGMNAWLVKPISLQTLHDMLVGLSAKLPPKEPEAPPVVATGVTVSPLQVPERMRTLFLESMSKDLGTARQAAFENDSEGLRQGVHRMAGALAVVRGGALVTGCREVEEGLLDGRLDCAAEEVTQVLDGIGQALQRLEDTG